MEEDIGNLLLSYFDKYVGTPQQVQEGELRCYGEVYRVHPKFASGVYDLYCFYREKASKITCDLQHLQIADRVYAVKGGENGVVSWSVETYKDPVFQAVFVARKFTLRVSHVMNMFVDAWNYGNLREVTTVQGFGSGPGMELYLLQKFAAIAGSTVVINHYDCVDWSAMGGATGKESCHNSDMLLTSFVNAYVSQDKLPAHGYHLALETEELEGYTVLNIGQRQEHDKFFMMQNRPMVIHGSKRRVVSYYVNEPFEHFFRSTTEKDRETSSLLRMAVGQVVDVGAGAYDITSLTPLSVIRFDVKPRDANTVTEFSHADTALFNMSFHHMEVGDIADVLSKVSQRVLIREVDKRRSKGYHDAVHLLHERRPASVRLAMPVSITLWMRERGWTMIREETTHKSTMQVYRRVAYPLQDAYEFRDYYDRTYTYDYETIKLLRKRHQSMCSGPLRPFHNFSTLRNSIDCCVGCSRRFDK